MGYEELQGKVIWVSGAAGTIGEAVCHQLADSGAVLVLTGRNEAKLNALLERLPGNSHGVIGTDVAKRQEVDHTAQRIAAEFGRIDVLVNSTTCPIFRPFLELEDDDWLQVLDAKLLGYVRTCRAAIPRMIETGGGVIVNISGQGGHRPRAPSHFAGCCANGGVNTLTKGLSLHFKDQGIRVNAVAPGPIASERYDHIAKADEEILRNKKSLSGAVAAPSDLQGPEVIADIVAFLASHSSRHLNGTVLQADGGRTESL